MPAKIANINTVQTDEDNLILALSHYRHLRDQSKIWSKLSQDTAVSDDFWYAMECLDDAVEKIDNARERLQEEREEAEYFSEQDSIRRDLATAVEG